MLIHLYNLYYLIKYSFISCERPSFIAQIQRLKHKLGTNTNKKTKITKHAEYSTEYML